MSRVLLVDDDETSIQILKIILEDEGFEVDLALTGSKAVEKASTGGYQVILLDYKLPDMRGRDVAAKIRGAGLRPKIVLLTGYTTDEDLYDKVLMKPVPPVEILEAIRETLKAR